jgi:hypothetical protein
MGSLVKNEAVISAACDEKCDVEILKDSAVEGFSHVHLSILAGPELIVRFGKSYLKLFGTSCFAECDTDWLQAYHLSWSRKCRYLPGIVDLVQSGAHPRPQRFLR